MDSILLVLSRLFKRILCYSNTIIIILQNLISLTNQLLMVKGIETNLYCYKISWEDLSSAHLLPKSIIAALISNQFSYVTPHTHYSTSLAFVDNVCWHTS